MVDVATQNYPSYCVEILGQANLGEAIVITLYTVKLTRATKQWWYLNKLTLLEAESSTRDQASVLATQQKN